MTVLQDTDVRACPELQDVYPHEQMTYEGKWYCPTCICLEQGECPRCGEMRLDLVTIQSDDGSKVDTDICRGCGWPYRDETDGDPEEDA